MARLSTHVLDVARGKPAQGVMVELHFLGTGTGERRHLKTTTTTADGRTGEPLLSGEHIETGTYELTFHAGNFFREQGIALADPPFLDQVVIRFGIADADGHYHVPLLLSPYSYSTYRGS
jgi:5-hydroxyisourate hydrolase